MLIPNLTNEIHFLKQDNSDRRIIMTELEKIVVNFIIETSSISTMTRKETFKFLESCKTLPITVNWISIYKEIVKRLEV